MGRSWIWAALTGLGILIGALIVDRAEEERFAEAERLGVIEAASGKRALLEAHLNARLHIINGLTALAYGQPNLPPGEFDTYAAGLVAGIPGVRAVQLAKDAVITHVWPIDSNRESLGHDLLADPERRDATRRTIAGRRLVLAGPFTLRQGGVGLVARQPIFLSKGGQEVFWGLAIIVVDLQPLLADAGLTSNGSLRIALRGKDGIGRAGDAFFGDKLLFESGAVLMDVTFPHGSWQLAAMPASGWSASRPGRWRFALVVLFVAGLGATVAAQLASAFARRRQAEEEMERNLSSSNALSRVLTLSLSSQPLDQLLEAALREILSLSWLELEQRGSVFLIDRTERNLVLAARYAQPDATCLACGKIPIGQCTCGRVLLESQTNFADNLDFRHGSIIPKCSDLGHYCIPIRGASGVVGVLNTYVAPGQARRDGLEGFLVRAGEALAGIIDRHRAQRDLIESEQRGKALMNATADPSCLIDGGGRILSCNAALAARHGCKPDELVDHSYFALLPAAQAEFLKRQSSIVFELAQPMHLFDERDGRTLEIRIYPVTDENKRVVQAALFCRDITEQKNAARALEKSAAELARSNEDLQQFAYAASHDLRQPLRMVSSYLTLIERKLQGIMDDDLQGYLGYAVNGARRMDRLILDLLDYARVGRSGEEMAALSLQEVIDEALENLGPAIADSQAEIVVVDPLPHVVGARIELVRLFQNLIGNALKYRSPERPIRVQITAERDQDGWLIGVRDNGMGIPANSLGRVFGVFQRLAGAEEVEGTGIGLAICKKIVEHHNGRIWVESEPDFGANFLFVLPNGVSHP